MVETSIFSHVTVGQRKKHMLKLEEALVLLETLKSNLRHKNERDRKLNQLKKRIQLQKKIIGACEDELEKVESVFQ